MRNWRSLGESNPCFRRERDKVGSLRLYTTAFIGKISLCAVHHALFRSASVHTVILDNSLDRSEHRCGKAHSRSEA